MVYALALAAALVSASAGITQRLGLETAPLGSAMRLRLLTYALRRGIWLCGFALLLAQFVLQAMALRFGQLSVVQPVLTMDLLFVVTILAVLFHRPIGWREWTGAGAIVAGLAGFLVIAHPATGKGNVGTHLWGIVTVSTFLAATALVLGAQRGARWWRAAAFGAASAILFAYNAALTKATTDLITHGWSHVFIHWEPYGIAVNRPGRILPSPERAPRRTHRRFPGDPRHLQPTGLYRHRCRRLRRAPPVRRCPHHRRDPGPPPPLLRCRAARPLPPRQHW